MNIIQKTTSPNTAPVKTRLPARKLVVAMAALTLGLGSTVASAGHNHRSFGHINHGHNQHNGHRYNYGRNNHGNRHNYGNRTNRRQAYGRVIDVQPVYKQVRVQKPHRECWTEYQEHNTFYDGQGYNSQQYQSQQHVGQRPSRRNSSSPLLGTIVGGVIGSQIGRYSNSSNGQLGGAIAGALIGTAIANESGSRSGTRNRNQYIIQNGHARERFDLGSRRNRNNREHRQQTYSRPVRRCETRTITTTVERISSYKVTYRYHGQIYHTNTRQHPGDRSPVDVTVRPRY